MRPTVGRIVHYFPVGDMQAQTNSNAGPIAAIITRVWSDTVVNLTLFPDYSEPQMRTSAQHKSVGTGVFAYWDWPERAE